MMTFTARRLLLELKLPPPDAYHKLRHTIEEVNTHIATFYGDDDKWQVRISMCRLRCFWGVLVSAHD